MNLYRKIERILLNWLYRSWVSFIMLHEWKNILNKRKLLKDIKLTTDQKRQIDEFYIHNYGKKIPYWWHRLYMSYTGRFDPQYMPEYIFTTKIEPRSNPRLEALPLENKNLLSALFGNAIKDGVVRIPKTYVMCIKGRFFDGSGKPVSESRVLKILKEIHSVDGEAVMKVTVDTNSGRGVRMLHLDAGDKENNTFAQTIKKVFSEMGTDFVIQEKIIPHPALKYIYAKSINTVRVITYITKEKVCVAPLTLRIGRGGATVDNAHAGGIFIGIDEDGKLLKEAFTDRRERFLSHPDTGVLFEGYQLPCMSQVRQAAIDLHQQIPIFNFVSWDLTVDQEGRVVLVEANLHSQSLWFPQMAHGRGVFEDNTAEILRLWSGMRG